MQITINIPEKAIAEAATLGVSVQEYMESLVQLGLEKVSQERGWVRNPEDFVRSLSRYSDLMPILPPEAFSRESISSDE